MYVFICFDIMFIEILTTLFFNFDQEELKKFQTFQGWRKSSRNYVPTYTYTVFTV